MKVVEASFEARSGKKKLRILIPEKKEPEQPEIKTGYISGISPSILIGAMPGMQQQQQEEEEDEQMSDITNLKKNAIDIPDIETERPEEAVLTEEDIKVIDMKYPLVPREPKKGERVFAYAHVRYESRLNEIVYYIIEPPLNMHAKQILENVKEFIQEKLDVNFAQVRRQEAIDYINNMFGRAIKYFKINYSNKYFNDDKWN